MDWLLMTTSTLVLIWAAAAAYSLYAHWYYAAGLRTFADMMAAQPSAL
jgi:hypothetical protein